MIALGDAFGFRMAKIHIPCSPLAVPLRLLHLSDAHMLVRDRAKQEFIKRATDDDYDFVFFTGDIAEEEAAEDLVPGLLSRRPRYGAFAVLGNHDHRRLSTGELWGEFLVGTKQTAAGRAPTGRYVDAAATKRRMEAGGNWQVLLNEAVPVTLDTGEMVVVAGVDDPFTRHGDLQATMRTVKQADVLIGLVHVPTDLASFSQRGFHLVLSGHTHGGQVRLPLYGALRTQCDLPVRHARGLHWIDRTAVHVSQGLGAGPLVRVRLFCPPTAYVITFGGPD